MGRAQPLSGSSWGLSRLASDVLELHARHYAWRHPDRPSPRHDAPDCAQVLRCWPALATVAYGVRVVARSAWGDDN